MIHNLLIVWRRYIVHILMFTGNCKVINWKPYHIQFMQMLLCTGQNLCWTLSVFSQGLIGYLEYLNGSPYVLICTRKFFGIDRSAMQWSQMKIIYCSFLEYLKCFRLELNFIGAISQNQDSKFQKFDITCVWQLSLKYQNYRDIYVYTISDPQWTGQNKATVGSIYKKKYWTPFIFFLSLYFFSYI